MNLVLYKFFRVIFRIALRFFFRAVEIKGKHNIPQQGPLIVVANHPATFLDPIVIGVNIGLPLFFLAKAVIFKSRIVGAFLRFFNVIPVYRSEDDPSSMGKNEETFQACYKHLANKGTIMIFPEGFSQAGRQLLKIKTGTARIALGAENQNNFKLGVQILSLGLNYSNQEKFQSTLFISMGEPIRVQDFQEVYQQDKWEAVTRLTSEIERRIEKQIINAGDENLDKLITNIEKLMKNRLLRELGVSKNEPEFDHQVTRKITEAVHYFRIHEPQRFSRLEKSINNYFESIKDVDLPENIFESRRLSLKSLLQYGAYFLSGLPFFLFGFLNNFIPFELSVFIARTTTGLKEYRGAIGFSAGTFIFLIFYAFEGYLVFRFTGLWFIALTYIVSVPLTGIFAYYYRKKFIRFYYKVIFAFSKRKFLLTNLLSVRNRIINQLESARQEFLKVQMANNQ